MCNKKQTYFGETTGGNTRGLKNRKNQHTSNCKTGVSTCKFSRHVYD